MECELGQEVAVLEMTNRQLIETCEACAGEGRIPGAHGRLLDCPECGGDGQIIRYRNVWIIRRGKVRGIQTIRTLDWIDGEEMRTERHLISLDHRATGGSKWAESYRVFPTYDAALEWARTREMPLHEKERA